MVKITRIRAVAVLIATGMKKQDVAKLIGVDPATISQYKRRDVHGINQMISTYSEEFKHKIAEIAIKGEA